MSRQNRIPAGDDSVMSPSSSDVGSASSSTVPASSQQGNDAVRTARRSRAARVGDGSRISTSSGGSTRRIGSLQGAGLSSLNLAAGSEAGYSVGPSLAGFNAISTLLNDPRKPQRPIDPSSSRYPAISQSNTDLPKVKRSDYDGTIQSVRAEWNRYKHSTALGIRGKAKFEGSQSTQGAGTIDDEASVRALGTKRLPPLSTVPQVFFAEDFDMGNPYTFDLVTERYKAAASSASLDSQEGGPLVGYDVALNQMLQEKMSYYSDVVEQHLILEISARSTSFFAALGNLQDLEAESRSCLDKVEQLKGELRERDEGVAKTGLAIVREQAKRREIAERLEAVGLLNQLCDKRDLCQLLIQNSEWSEALDVMSTLASLVAGSERLASGSSDVSSMQPYVDIDIAEIPAIQAMAPQLNEMRESIAAQLEVELLSILTADVEARLESETKTELEGTERSSQASDDTGILDVPVRVDGTDKPLAHQLHAHMLGLLRTGSVDRVLNGYREALLRAVRTTMRTVLADAEKSELRGSVWLGDLATLLEDDDAASGRPDATLSAGGAQAASRLRELPLPQFISLLQSLLGSFLGLTKATDVQRRILIKLLDDEGRHMLGDNSKEDTIEFVMPPGVSPSLPANLNSIVSDVCSLTHTLASRLQSLRSSAHVNLRLDDFLTVFELSWTFILASEAVCGRMIIGLRGVVLNQAKNWLSAFHRQRIEKAAKAVEEEQWAPTDVSATTQARIQHIVESATHNPEELVSSKAKKAASDGSKAVKADESYTKTLEIANKQYWVVPASLEVLHLLVDYLSVVINLPLLTTDIMGRVVEFLKQFNSRTCQVVLGAGAMRSAGLKNITARHLALASQSLSVMITLVPYIREAIRRHLNPRQAVMLVEFDKLKGDYQEHQNEIHSKLIAIMSDRLTVHCRSLSNLDWSATTEKLQDGNDYDGGVRPPVKPIADLIRETTVLHKRLCTYLQPSVVEHIIGQVLLSTDERVSAELSHVEGHDDDMKARVKAIPVALKDSYGGLRFVTWSSKAIDSVVDEIEKREPPPPPPAPAPAPVEAEKVTSPTLPPAYKPRLNIFARRNQQAQQSQSANSPVLNGRPSTDTRADGVPRASADDTPAATPNEEVKQEALTGSVAELPLAQGSKTVTPEEAAPSISIARPGKEEPAGVTSPLKEERDDLADVPPPTPEKDHRGREFAGAGEDDLNAATVSEGLNTPPRTPDKSNVALPQTAIASSEGPALQGDTPRTATTRSSAPPPSATPVRMTLQQRLAEAAKKRAQASAANSGGNNSRSDTPRQSQSQDSPVEHVAAPTSAPPLATATPQLEASQAEASKVEEKAETAVQEKVPETAAAVSNEASDDIASAETNLEDSAARAEPAETDVPEANAPEDRPAEQAVDGVNSSVQGAINVTEDHPAPSPPAADETAPAETSQSDAAETRKQPMDETTSDQPQTSSTTERSDLASAGREESAAVNEANVTELSITEGPTAAGQANGEVQAEEATPPPSFVAKETTGIANTNVQTTSTAANDGPAVSQTSASTADAAFSSAPIALAAEGESSKDTSTPADEEEDDNAGQGDGDGNGASAPDNAETSEGKKSKSAAKKARQKAKKKAQGAK